MVAKQAFDYKVINNGVARYGIAYTSRAALSQEALMGFATLLREDAHAKCNVLGAIEGKRTRAGYSYMLIPHMDIKLAFESGKDPGLFACNVTIGI